MYFYLHEQRVRVKLPVGRPSLHEEAVLQVSEECLHLHCEVLVVVRVLLLVLQELRHGHGGVVGRGGGRGRHQQRGGHALHQVGGVTLQAVPQRPDVC